MPLVLASYQILAGAPMDMMAPGLNPKYAIDDTKTVMYYV